MRILIVARLANFVSFLSFFFINKSLVLIEFISIHLSLSVSFFKKEEMYLNRFQILDLAAIINFVSIYVSHYIKGFIYIYIYIYVNINLF